MSPQGDLAFVLSFSKPLIQFEINGKSGIQNAQAAFEISDLFLSNSVQERRKKIKVKLFSEVHSNFQAKKKKACNDYKLHGSTKQRSISDRWQATIDTNAFYQIIFLLNSIQSLKCNTRVFCIFYLERAVVDLTEIINCWKILQSENTSKKQISIELSECQFNHTWPF